MRLVCGLCKKVEEAKGSSLADGWVIPTLCMDSERKETGKNPLGYGVVKAFCSQGCADKAKSEFLKGNLFKGN
jgi:hypothetical protein